MYIFRTITPLQQFVTQQKESGKRIGFVPTMGALHQGHISLLGYCGEQTEVSVCSIFVNPTQFNVKEDFEKYPRTIEADILLLEQHGCHVLFLPDVTEIYPLGAAPEPVYDFGLLDKVMEGSHRPGHFNGVAQVVNRLLQIVQPNALFMGQKDYQQVKIIDSLLKQTNSLVQLVMCPTLREPDGLAMSSRNVRLTPHNREQAFHIYQALLIAALSLSANQTPAKAQQTALQYLTQHLPQAVIEYLEIVNAYTLQKPDSVPVNTPLVICVALWLGNVRLIDNLPMNKGHV
ncbi:MAG TPA: pantoate--beta-alanine ligase [Chitinophagales bacterium]|nr:pantoate--beta-alanine ligase [Chitinophagales bacterium]